MHHPKNRLAPGCGEDGPLLGARQSPHSFCIRHFHDSQFLYILWPTMFNNISTVMKLYGVNLKHRFLILFEHRLLYNTSFSRGGNFRYIREFGFCAKFSSREINIHCAWNFAKFSSREIFFPRIFPPRENQILISPKYENN